MTKNNELTTWDYIWVPATLMFAGIGALWSAYHAGIWAHYYFVEMPQDVEYVKVETLKTRKYLIEAEYNDCMKKAAGYKEGRADSEIECGNMKSWSLRAL